MCNVIHKILFGIYVYVATNEIERLGDANPSLYHVKHTFRKSQIVTLNQYKVNLPLKIV